MPQTIVWYEGVFFLASLASSILNFSVSTEAAFLWATNWIRKDDRKKARWIAEIGLIYSVVIFFLTTVNTAIGFISFFAPNRPDLSAFEMSFVLILTSFAVLAAVGSVRIHFLLKRIFA